MIDRIVANLISAVKGSPRFDAGSTLGYPLPEQVICEIVGAPYEDFALWEPGARVISSFPRTRPPTEDEVRTFVAAAAFFLRYFTAMLDDRKPGGDDLVSTLLAANADNLVSPEELVALIVLVIIAGHDTTANMVTNGLYWLLRNPEEYRKLRSDPSLVPSAVEEMLRYEPSAPFPPPRRTIEAAEIAGTTIPAGCSVLVANHGAGRDPRYFLEPDRFDISRFNGERPTAHLAFGFGIHRCLGEHLARAELQSMFHAIVTELPELEIVEKGNWHPGFFRHIESLVVAPITPG